MALILKLEDGSNGLLIARHAGIDISTDRHQFLGAERECTQEQQQEYGIVSFHHYLLHI
jgi:hypothetical protein